MAHMDKFNEYIYMNLVKKSSNVYLTQFGRALPNCDYRFFKRDMARHLFDYVVSGKGYINFSDKRYEVGAGDLIYMKKGVDIEYGADSSEPYEKLWFALDGDVTTALTDSYLHGRELIIVHNSDIEPFLRMKNIVSAQEYSERLILHTLIDILMPLAASPDAGGSEAKNGKIAGRIKKYIDARVAEQLSLDDASEYFHISKRHIIRVFKEKYSTTPGIYHNELRLSAAADYLCETTYTVGEISELLGYCDQSFFSTAFKKKYGMYPLAYRKIRLN